ncbi:MAG TPA: hypothetical protein VL201_00115 [Patescibacteria group bacterium]|jgi:hypothetical protein|nr:hypothetical protein [Patescibacteria group bacterium]
MKKILFFCLVLFLEKTSMSMEQIITQEDPYGLIEHVINNKAPWQLFDNENHNFQNWSDVYKNVQPLKKDKYFNIIHHFRGDIAAYTNYYWKLLKLYCKADGKITTFVDNVLKDKYFQVYYEKLPDIKIPKTNVNTVKIKYSVNFFLVESRFIEELIKNSDGTGLIKDDQLTLDDKQFIQKNIEVLCCYTTTDQKTLGKNILGFVEMFLQMKYLSSIENPTIDILLEKVLRYWDEKNQISSTGQSNLATKDAVPAVQTWGQYIWSWLSPSAWYQWWFAIQNS